MSAVSHEKLLEQILAAGSGRIVGKIRFQKIVYLLERLGMNSGFAFSYHYYGPYSEQASIALQRAVHLDHLFGEVEEPNSFGGTYSIFALAHDLPVNNVGELDGSLAADLIGRMKAVPSVVIELAATIDWLRSVEKVADWKYELKLRKPTKASDDNIGKALSLLSDLKL